MTEPKQATAHPFDPVTYGNTAFERDEDIPDMSTPHWVEKFAKAKVQRGRPVSKIPKISTTLQLDPDVLERFKADGPGWQGRISAALRRSSGL